MSIQQNMKKTRIPIPTMPVSSVSTDGSGLKPKPPTLNPLAKAMEKKPKSNKVSQPETWYDEKVESVSQKQQQQTTTDHERRKEALYAQLKQTEEELVTMQDLLIKREKLIKEAEEGNESAEKENGGGEAVLAETGSEEQPEKVEKITKKSMKNMRERMQAMREKLHVMNTETDCYLADIENTVQYLESLEVASGKFGPMSEETRQVFGDVDDEEIIAEITKENKQPEKEMAKSKTDKDSEEDDEQPEGDAGQDLSNRPKFFLTEKTAMPNHVHNNDDDDADEQADNVHNDDDVGNSD